MKHSPTFLAHCLCALAVLLPASPLAAAERRTLPRISSPRAQAFTQTEREALASWALGQPEVKRAVAGHRTRLLRVWSDVAKGPGGSYRRAVVLLRDYDAGKAIEVSTNLTTSAIDVRELMGIQPSEDEIEEGMAIVRRDRKLAALVENRGLKLMGGFHTVSLHADDPCSREVCLDFAFMKPNYGGPARYVIVNLSRGIVAHHDFRGSRPGEPPARMTEPAAR